MPNEMTHADSLRFYLTGAASDGAAQSDPDASLGLWRSSSEVAVFDITETGSVGDIDIEYADGANGIGDGLLTASGVSELRWTAPGGSIGAAVTILNGETKILEDGGDSNKYIRVKRTSAVNLSGTETITLADKFNNVFGHDNISSGEASAGHTDHRCICAKNEASGSVTVLKVYLNTLGTRRTSDVAALPGSGAGIIQTSGSFADWPNVGYCRITDNGGTLREIVYYSSRTDTVLTVPAAGRGLLGTSAGAGAATDVCDAVPGIRIGIQAPSSQPAGFFEDETGDETVPPAAVTTWYTGITPATGAAIGTLTTGQIYGIWVQREIPAVATAAPSFINPLLYDFDAA